jgi:acyl carrier protein
MTGDDVLLRLNHIFRDVLDDDDLHLTPTTTATDVDEWDSLSHVRLMLTVEREFRIKLNAAEISGLKNVGELVTLIQTRTA